MAEENKLLNDPYFSTEATVKEPQEQAVEAPQEKAVEARPANTERANPLLSDPYFQTETSKRPASTTTVTAPTPVSPTRRTTHANPTLYHQAPIKQPGEKDLTVGETLSGAAKNFIPSALGVVGSFAHALTHPSETLGAVGDIGTGLLSKAAGATGAQQDPTKKKQEERVVNGLWDHYKKTYFTSSQDFMRAFKKDPASILLDFSTLTGVGAAGLPGKFGQAAKIAATVTDPIQSSLAIARGVGSLPARALRLTQATTSGVPYSALTDIYNMSKNGNSVQRGAFKDGRTFTEGQIVDEFADTISGVADKASANYASNIAGLDKIKPDYSKVLDVLRKEEDALRNSAGQIEAVNQNAYKQIQDMRRRVLDYDSHANHNLIFADKFKRDLGNERYKFEFHDPARGATDRVKAAVRDAIAAGDSKYANAMDQWQSWISQAKDLKSVAGQPNSGVANTMAKIMKAMKSDLKKKNVIDALAQHNERIPYLLAGYATKPWHKGNIGLMDAVLGGVGYYAVAHPAGAAVALAGASPRLSSMSQTGLGKLAKVGSAATSRPVTAGAYYGERALQEEGQQPSEENMGMPQGDNSLPRNVRNNNPGNIIDSDFAKRQPGYVGTDGQFAVFDKPENGYLAHKTLLSSYGSEGRDTIDAIIEKWSPSEGKGNTPEGTNNYKLKVAKRLGVGIHDRLDMSDPNVLDALSKAMANFEGDKRAAAGGRIGRATGGRIMNHRSEAENLIRLADKTKKALNNSTESLLAVPDEAVTKALSIANEAI